MIPLPLAWTLLTVSLWASGSSQILQRETATILYPKINSSESVECACVNITCDSVYWFRSLSQHSGPQYLGKYNNADRVTHAKGVDEARFKLSRRSSSAFVLRVINVTEEDTGIYFCVLKDRKDTELWKPTILLQPGVTPPTPPPKTNPPPVKTVCRCPKKKPSLNICGSVILWSLVGLLLALALALICTLYYFSRLPKKCRHRFVKTRQMT